MKHYLLIITAFLFTFISCSEEKGKPEVTDNNTDTRSEIEVLNEAIVSQPNNYLVYVNRANFYINNGQYGDATSDINKAIELNANNAEVNYTKGVVLLETGQVEPSVTFFEHAIELDSNHARSYLKLAYINLAIPNYDKSITFINKALRINKFIAEGYFLKGMWYEKQGKLALASSSYQTAIQTRGDYYEAYIAQGIVHDKQNNPLAIDFFKSAIELRPNSIEAWRLMGISYKDHNQFDEALACFDSIIAINPNFEVAYFDKGATLLQLCYDSNPKAKNDSLMGEALILFNQALAVNKNYVDAKYNKGLIFEEQGKIVEAKQEYNEVLKLQTNYSLAIEGLNRLDKK